MKIFLKNTLILSVLALTLSSCGTSRIFNLSIFASGKFDVDTTGLDLIPVRFIYKPQAESTGGVDAGAGYTRTTSFGQGSTSSGLGVGALYSVRLSYPKDLITKLLEELLRNQITDYEYDVVINGYIKTRHPFMGGTQYILEGYVAKSSQIAQRSQGLSLSKNNYRVYGRYPKTMYSDLNKVKKLKYPDRKKKVK